MKIEVTNHDKRIKKIQNKVNENLRSKAKQQATNHDQRRKNSKVNENILECVTDSTSAKTFSLRAKMLLRRPRPGRDFFLIFLTSHVTLRLARLLLSLMLLKSLMLLCLWCLCLCLSLSLCVLFDARERRTIVSSCAFSATLSRNSGGNCSSGFNHSGFVSRCLTTRSTIVDTCS